MKILRPRLENDKSIFCPSFVARRQTLGTGNANPRRGFSVLLYFSRALPLRFHRLFSSLLLVREDRKVLQQSQLFQYSNFLSLSSVEYDNATFTISDSRFKATVGAFSCVFKTIIDSSRIGKNCDYVDFSRKAH